jgi:DNA primase
MDVVRRIRDVSLRADYARQLAGWLGLPDPDELVMQARGSVGHTARTRPTVSVDHHDPALLVEREALKVALQEPTLVRAEFDTLDAGVFTAPPYAGVRAAILAAGGTAAGFAGEAWVARVREHAADDAGRSLVTELAVEPLQADGPGDAPAQRYATALLARLEELAATRRITEVKGRLQRLNPVEQVEDYNRLFGSLVALEQHRRQLRERAIGAL